MDRFVLLIFALTAAGTIAFTAQFGRDGALPEQWANWQWWRPFELPATEQPRLARSSLPAEVFGKAEADLRDLRVIHENGSEVAFLIHSRPGGRRHEWISLEIAEISHVPSEYTQALVDVGADAQRHDRIELQLRDSAPEFVAHAEVAVSDDGQPEWRVLAQSQNVYHFPRQPASHLSISYSETRARWLRLRLRDPAGTSPAYYPLSGVRLADDQSEPPELVELPAQAVAVEGAPRGQSWWEFDLRGRQAPALQVRFQTETKQFRRRVEVQVNDSGQRWIPVGFGTIQRLSSPSSLEPQDAAAQSIDFGASNLVVQFPESRGRFLRIVVHDGNDPPLEQVSLHLWGVPRHVVFRQEPGREYLLLYGNERAQRPHYELAQLTRPEEVTEATQGSLGEQRENAAWSDPRPWSEKNPVVLWAALVLAIGALIWLALRSLRPPARA